MDKLLKVKQVAEVLGVNIATVYTLLHKRKLASVIVGGSYRISEVELNRFLQVNKIKVEEETE